MQSWSMREHIVRAVPKDRLSILDINSQKTASSENMWGYPVVSGMLHNFGGKSAMQGKLRLHCENKYLSLKKGGANTIGSGMFMEWIEQNPVVYDLQFQLLTQGDEIDFNLWLDDYILRRYGKYSKKLRCAWDILLRTCYRDDGYDENAVGSVLASRPQLMPVVTGSWCLAKVYYDTAEFEKAVSLFFSARDEFKDSDGYQYDLCDLMRQALSNRFYDNQVKFKKSYLDGDLGRVKSLSETQLEIILDLDDVTSCRSEMCLSRWICDSHRLAADDNEKRYFDMNARTLITVWGNAFGDFSQLYDYSWREWSGLVREYYYVRWSMFYEEAVRCLEQHKRLKIKEGNDCRSRKKYLKYDLGKRLGEFELAGGRTYGEYEYPEDKNVIPFAEKYINKWNIG